MNIKLVVILLFSVLLAACVPMLSRGEYVLFQKTPGIEVLETGIPEKRDFSPKRPIFYRLNEGVFSIQIRLGKNGRLATFSTQSNLGKKLRLRLLDQSSSQTEQACLFVTNEFNTPYDQYLKLQLWNIGCETYKTGTHSFDVAILDGDKTLGTKKIFFELKKGGYYVWYDAV